MKILISGYYGFGNVGDEAVLEVIAKGLGPNEICVLSATPELTREFHQVESIYRYDWLGILSKMKEADVFISGGGTLFQDATSVHSFWYYIGLVWLAKSLGKKVVVFAQGFGPLQRNFNRWLAKAILNKVDLITLRDQDSCDKLAELGIRKPPLFVTADPSLLLEIPSKEESKKILKLEGVALEQRSLLGISVRSAPGLPLTKLAKTIDDLVRKHNYLPVFILFESARDLEVVSKVIASMQESAVIIFRSCRPREMLGIISHFDLLIGMRLHSLIFAAMNKIPCLGISYDPKVASFMKSIDQPCVSSDLDSLDQILKNLIENRREYNQRLEIETNKARQNFIHFQEVFR